MKRCRECGEEKPLDEFYAHAQMVDGHLNKCKPCVKSRVGKHRELNLNAVRAYDRRRGEQPHRIALRKHVAEKWKSDPELRSRSQRQKASWAEKNAEKTIAHHAVSTAIRDGRLKPHPCARCNEPKADAHHDDYSKPLDVRWLCRKHHAERHKELRALARGEP